jgi:micrococcal nuclease
MQMNQYWLNWRLARRLRLPLSGLFTAGLLVPSFPVGAADIVAPPLRSPSCTLALQAAGVAVEVIDGTTLKLSDGQIVRLAGLVAPTPPLAIGNETWQPERAAKDALATLVANNANIEIAVADPKARMDRHGRTLAHVIATANGKPTWIQGTLLQSGHARATSMLSGGLCLKEMLSFEASGRAKSVGLWANPAYNPVRADSLEALKRQRTTFAIVEGVVMSVADRGGRTYLNFGKDWKWDFTVRVSKSVLKRDPEAAAKLAGLGGQRVRVRGWLDHYNGPIIEIGDLAEIEVIGDGL